MDRRGCTLALRSSSDGYPTAEREQRVEGAERLIAVRSELYGGGAGGVGSAAPALSKPVALERGR